MIRFLLLFSVISSFSFPTSKEEIKQRIEDFLSKLPSSTNTGMLIYNPLSQDTIFATNFTQSMIPASNTKLFTTAAALNIMGGDFYLYTKLLSDDGNIKDGVIDGNLYLKGYGNSIFTEADLEQMIDELRQLSITKITGHIIGDDTYFDDVYTRDDWIKDEVSNVKLPPISALVIDRNRDIVYRKRGKRTRSYKVFINDPPLHASTLFREKLINAGIDVEGNAQKGKAPEMVFDLSESKILLRDLVKLINKNSDNFLAECLFKTIGAEASGTQGNSFYSTQAVLDFIEENRIFSEGTAVVDGSGISRFNQITVGAIAGVLEKMYFDLINFDDYYNSLSVAGVDGTLKHRMMGTTAENNFHGKTGTLNGVCSLSGYLTNRKGDDLIVSIFFEFNKGSADFYRDIQDEIVELLADWN